MTGQLSNADLAERYSRRRARMMPALAAIFLIQQIAYFSHIDSRRAVEHVRIGAWVVMSVVLLLILARGGAWRRPAAVRALMDDDVTRANRATAMQLGFILAIGGAIAIYPFIDMLELTARQLTHLIVSLGLTAAMLRFGLLERRALA